MSSAAAQQMNSPPPSLQLVLLPGLDGTGSLFRPFLEALAARDDRVEATVISYPSDRVLSATELHAYVESSLPDDQPYWLLAESFAGPMGMTLAARGAPHRCQGLILCATYARNPRPVLSHLFPLVRYLPLVKAVRSQVVRIILGKHHSIALSELFREASAAVREEVFLSRLQQAIDSDASDSLTLLNHSHLPVMCLMASHDWVVPNPATMQIPKVCPDCELQVFDAPHGLLQVKPQEAATAVCNFMARRREV